ncbi:MAG: DUF4124 domain-containing protein [Chromatiales bacterium]|nr:DUF4124 domain-containing protein [Chromatiales bacterium]
MRLYILLLLLICHPLAAETGYRYIHPDGTVEFSDAPIKGGEEIKLEQVPTIKMPATSGRSAGSRDGKAKQREAEERRSVTIASPQANQNIRFDGKGFDVSVSVSPSLQKGERVVIELDGRKVAEGAGSSFNVGPVFRGTHTVAAHIVAEGGSRVASSPSVTFTVMQRSIQHQQGRESDPLESSQ